MMDGRFFWRERKQNKEESRVATFFLTQNTKTGDNIPNGNKITKRTLTIPNGLNMKIPTFFIPRPTKICTIWTGFLFENIPSGNPGGKECLGIFCLATQQKN
jgi:hypothetical protein